MLTEKEIDNLEAGRDLDELFGSLLQFKPIVTWEILNEKEDTTIFSANSRFEAEQWLKENLEKYPDSWLKNHHVGSWKFYPLVSTKIEAAWLIVKKLTDDNWKPHPLYFKLLYRWDYGDNADAQAIFDWKLTGDGHPLYHAMAKTAPLAICKAALKVIWDLK